MGAISPFATPALEAVSQRLDALMQRARHLKPVGTVEPPLPIADFSDENGIPLDITGLPIGAHNSVVETAARRLYQAKAASTDINSPAFVDVWNLFDILNICGDQGMSQLSCHSQALGLTFKDNVKHRWCGCSSRRCSMRRA